MQCVQIDKPSMSLSGAILVSLRMYLTISRATSRSVNLRRHVRAERECIMPVTLTYSFGEVIWIVFRLLSGITRGRVLCMCSGPLNKLSSTYYCSSREIMVQSH